MRGSRNSSADLAFCSSRSRWGREAADKRKGEQPGTWQTADQHIAENVYSSKKLPCVFSLLLILSLVFFPLAPSFFFFSEGWRLFGLILCLLHYKEAQYALLCRCWAASPLSDSMSLLFRPLYFVLVLCLLCTLFHSLFLSMSFLLGLSSCLWPRFISESFFLSICSYMKDSLV